MTTQKQRNWTLDDGIVQLIAEGKERIDVGDRLNGMALLSVSGKALAFRNLKFREALNKSKPRKRK